MPKNKSVTPKSGRSQHRIEAMIRTDYAIYKLEWIPCYKSHCRCCPHGPYWYAYRSEKTNKPGKRVRFLSKVVRTEIGRRFMLLPGDPGRILHDSRMDVG